jgi:hypothetical protein
MASARQGQGAFERIGFCIDISPVFQHTPTCYPLQQFSALKRPSFDYWALFPKRYTVTFPSKLRR